VTTDEHTAADPSGDGTRAPEMVRVKVRVRRSRRSRRRLIILGVLLVVVVAGVAMALLAWPLVSAKHEAQAAQDDLTSAKAALQDDRYAEARQYVDSARGHVDKAQSDVGGVGGDVWSVVPVARGAVQDERHLVDALDETTSAAQLGVGIYPIVSGRSAKIMSGQRIDVKLLQDVADRATSIGGHLDQALSDLQQVNGSTPLVGSSVTHAKTTALNYLMPLQETYRSNGPLIRALPSLVGAHGSRTYLLAMLNPAELRYSGGGALSFTTVQFKNGVARFGSSVNVDDLSAQGDVQVWPRVPGNPFHPRPAQRVTNSTFSPWWSVSGEELLRGYQKAFPGTPFNGLIAIDLQGLANLFKITGPIDMRSFGTITSDNLVKTLGGSYGNFASNEQRHRLNAELVPAFRQQFFEGGQMSDKVRSLMTSAQGRHFVIYSRNRRVEKSLDKVGLAGDLSKTPYDYLGIFSQNTNGSKTDYWQHRDVTSTVRLRPDGTGLANLHVVTTNQAPPYALPGEDPRAGYPTRYLGTRVALFLPRKATVTSAHIDGKPADLPVHFPNVATVKNRKFVQDGFMLNSGQSSTFDVTYRILHAAQVLDSSTMVYRLDIDPQDLVSPPVYHLRVIWPDGYQPTGTLPAGWKATKNGASFDGAVTTKVAWEIPLSSS